MKQLIVLLASILLGLSIVNSILIDDNSIYKSMQSLWRHESEVRNMQIIR